MAKTKTLKEFIKDAKRVHGNRYSYSKVNYVNTKTDVVIICPEHGPFKQKPAHRMRGQGCQVCGIATAASTRKLTMAVFLKRARKVHGNKYRYEKTVYAGYDTKVKITCKEHGVFTQTPDSHLSGRGCLDCRRVAITLARRHTTEKFIERAKLKHGTKYSYDRAVYTTKDAHIIVTCKKHGDFTTIANNHVRGWGCAKCKAEKCGDRCRMTTEEFIKRATKIHKRKYTYAKSVYVKRSTPVIITCKKHGDFKQGPDSHLSGSGCQECGRENQISKVKHSVDMFIARAKNKFGNAYDYKLVEYVNARTEVSIICKEHGEFRCTPWSHIHGGCCWRCTASSGELAVAAALDSLKLKYKTQQKLTGCKSKLGYGLIFDFIVTKRNSFGIIEYDGEQHTRSVASWGGDSVWKAAKTRDKIKDKYAAKNNIPILRINYTQGSFKLRIKEWMKSW